MSFDVIHAQKLCAKTFYAHKLTTNQIGLSGRGYLPPEYVLEGRLSDKVDVYSFGVVLLEVVSGRKNINPNLSPEKIYLPRWVSPKTTYILIFAKFD